jgi:ABC-type cobalamin/Fe3+-siderophores transport system ATPase subunit
VLAAYKDISDPWKELLKYYQTKEDARIKYELLVENFEPAGMLEERMQADEPEEFPILSGELVVANLDLREEDEGDGEFVGGATFKFDLKQRVAMLGKGASGKKRLAKLLAGVGRPLSGSVSVGDITLTDSPETVTGRRIAYVGQESRLRSGSLRDNLFYILKHRPLRAAVYDEDMRQEREVRRVEAAMAGNSEHDINADWIDYAAAGLAGPNELNDRAVDVLNMVDMDEDIYQLGLKGAIDPEKQPELATQILQARNALRDRISDPEVAPLVELFDRNRFNSNMTIAENLLFGTPCDDRFQIENLSANDYVRKVLEDTDLMPQFIEIGRKLAAVMVDLFADVEPGSSLFEQYSFIRADDLPTFQSMLTRIEGVTSEQLTPEDKSMLLSLPFKLIPTRHRLGLVDERLQARLLEARHAFAEGLGEQKGAIEFFDRERYSPAVSTQDNILFGRLVYGKPRAASTVGKLIGEIAEKLGLRRALMQVGLDHQVGIGGSRLSPVQRQKIAIARAVLKHPDLLVIDEATAAMDGATQAKVMKALFSEFKDRGLIWVLHRASLSSEFDHTLVLDGGKVVEQGRFTDLDKPNTVLQELVLAG